MPFNPSLPTEHTLADAAQMRAQFNGVVELIQTIPAGPQGVPGVSVTGAVVDGVASLNPGEPATASASFDGALVHFSFGIPQGNDGVAGVQGLQGEVGPEGAPFTSFVVDAVATLPPSEPATVTATFDGTFVRFAFGIPQGIQGIQGFTGADGATGPQGIQGPQGNGGEVTPEHLATAIAGTSSNTNSIATLDIAISDPPTQSEMQQMQAKMNELIVALRR